VENLEGGTEETPENAKLHFLQRIKELQPLSQSDWLRPRPDTSRDMTAECGRKIMICLPVPGCAFDGKSMRWM
jgi:hypothetical protein